MTEQPGDMGGGDGTVRRHGWQNSPVASVAKRLGGMGNKRARRDELENSPAASVAKQSDDMGDTLAQRHG